MKDSISYEVHLRGFTKNDSSVTAAARGTYDGFGSKASYLKTLGVTAAELLPIHEYAQFDDPVGGATADRINYWGYMTTQFFAPNREYLCTDTNSCTYRRGPAGGQVQGHGQGPPRPGGRGLARRRLQSHLGGRRLLGEPGAVHQPARHRQRDLLHPGRRQVLLLGLDRHRQQPERQPRRRAQPHRRQPHLLGEHPARRRLPLRPRLRAGARGDRRPGFQQQRHHPGRDRPGRLEQRLQGDRRAVGHLRLRRRPVPRRLVGMERQLPRQPAAVREGGQQPGGQPRRLAHRHLVGVLDAAGERQPRHHP